MSRSNPRRSPPPARLRITTSAPVMIVRGPQTFGAFSYTDDEWVKVVSTHPSCNQHQLLVALETAGQRYQASRRDPRSRRRAPKRALIHDALQAWSNATGDTVLRVSRTHHFYIEHGPPDGPLIRYLEAALTPIMGEDMVGREALIKAIKAIRRARR